MLHNFKQSLALSSSLATLAFDTYRQVFPLVQTIEVAQPDTALQLSGVDLTLHHIDGSVTLIEEKVRHKSHPDLWMEVTSCRHAGTPGWINKPQAADYFSYVDLPRGKVYVYYYPLLQHVWRCHSKEWMRTYGTRDATQDTGSKSVGCCVPFDVLDPALDEGCMNLLVDCTKPYMTRVCVPLIVLCSI